MLHKKPHQNPQKGFTSTTPQDSPPHELRKGRAASPRGPFAIRGAWGDFVPPTKKTLKELRHHFVDVFEIGFVVLGTW